MWNKRIRGQVIVLFAVSLVVLIGLAALGIDVGYMYSVRHELQRCADAGALAGASVFQLYDWNLQGTKDQAKVRAMEFASKDLVVETPLNSDPSANTYPPSEVTVAFPQLDHIRVDTYRNLELFFARIFGMRNRTIHAFAVAKATVTDITTNCIKPWAIPFPWDDDGPNSVYDRRGNPNGLYDSGPPGETVYADANGEPVCVNPNTPEGLCQGTLLTMKIGTPNDNTAPSGQQTAGQFFIIQGNLGGTNWFTGGSDYREAIKGCFEVDMNLPLDLLTGDKVGPTKQGVQDLIDGDPNSRWDTTAKLPEDPSGPYNFNDNTWMNSPRVVRVAIYDPSIPMQGSTGGQGTHVYIPTGYNLAGFWIEDIGAQGTITGRFIPASAFGSSSGTTPGPHTGTEVKKIVLVQ